MILSSAGPSAAVKVGKTDSAAVATDSYIVQFSDTEEEKHGACPPAFKLKVRDRRQLHWLLSADAYSAAASFIRGDFDVEGDIVAAVRFQLGRHHGWREFVRGVAARAAMLRFESWFQSRTRAAEDIRFHYDRSTAFYQQFLDARMVYSCAYFQHPAMSLDDAQIAKLDRICRKLDLRTGDRFLDIGCGWGALLNFAAEHYSVQATGCTLSRKQADFARESAQRLTARADVHVREIDFRDISGRFDKIASVGMFEHVGRRRLHDYFRKVYDLIEPGGLFLNHGIVRPEFVTDGSESLFLQRRVFPGGELPHLSAVIRAAELAGFEVLDLEDLRPHYALTCRAWVERLQRNKGLTLETVDHETYRTWLLYLAGSAANFENGVTSVCQLLMGKRTSPTRRLTRDYMYSGSG